MVLDDKAAVDIDPRNGGASTFNREWKERLSEDLTLVSQTASGGAHLIYALPEGVRLKSRANAFGQGVDLKTGSGAYLVAPGSVIRDNPDHPHCDGEYTWLRERPITLMPGILIEHVGQATSEKSKHAGERLAEETDGALEQAEKWLREHAPEAEQGERDNTAYTVACKLYDFGLADSTVLGLMLEWNETKCSPPLELHDIERVASSGGRNRQKPIGVDRTTDGFDREEIDESKHPHRRARDAEDDKKDEDGTKPFVSLATPFSFPDSATIDPPDWIVEGLAARGEVSALTGPGGVAKSTWSLHAAVAAVTGRSNICGFQIARRGRAWVWNQEDSLDAMNARTLAIMQGWNISRVDLLDEDGNPMLFLNSGRGRGKRLTLVERKGDFLKPTDDLKRLIDTAVHESADLISLDPLISLHEAKENSNEEMREVFDYLADAAHDANCAILALCHTGKPDKKSSTGFTGDAYAIRGASSQVDAARVAATIMSMSVEDLKKWSIPAGSHLEYVRIDEAKSNIGPRRLTPHWYRREQIIVPGYRGGRLPVLRPVDLEPVKGTVSAEERAAQLAQAIRDHHGYETWVPVAALCQHLPVGLAAALNGKNSGRTLDQIFAFKQEIEVADFGILKRVTQRGRKGTKLMLSESPPASNPSKRSKPKNADAVWTS